MVFKGRPQKYKYSLGILIILFLFSCSNEEKFDLTINSFNGFNFNEKAVLTFTDLSTNKIKTYDVEKNNDFSTDLNLNHNYQIIFNSLNYFGYISKIKPNENNKIILNINKKNNFRPITLNENININNCFLYDNYNIFYLNNNLFEKLSLLDKNIDKINYNFDKSCVNIDKNFILTENSVVNIKNNKINEQFFNKIFDISNIIYKKISETEYFIINNSQCLKISQNEVLFYNDCVSEQLEQASIVVSENKIYLLNNKKIYFFENNKFNFTKELDINGKLYNLNNKIYLINDKIYKIILNNWNYEEIPNISLNISNFIQINENYLIILPDILKNNEKFYIFNAKTENLYEYSINEFISLTDFDWLQLDEYQLLFFSKSTQNQNYYLFTFQE